MRVQLNALRKPPARKLASIFDKYYGICQREGKKEIVVREPDVNWKALIMSLPKPLNIDVLGCGIRKILVKETECVYQGVYRFHVVRLDGSECCFEWREAYDDAYHSFKDKSFKDDVECALRAAVLPQLVQYKEMLSKDSQLELVSHVSGISLPWERAVVQHFPISFEIILDAFLNENQLRMEQIKLDGCLDHGYKLKDLELLDHWRVFHRNQAHYRVISTDEAMDQDSL
jgi:hypothetical protein